MYSWLHDVLKMVRSYFVVELIFGLWGLACGYAVFVLKLNEHAGMAVAIVGGFLTALPAWSYLSRVPGLPVNRGSNDAQQIKQQTAANASRTAL